MPKQEGYEVIRFVEKGKNCHVIMDYEEGQILIRWLKAHPVVGKKQLFQWLIELMKQLDLLHHSQEGMCYRYLTPFSILMTRQQKVMLLDLNAKDNEFLLKQLQRRSIRSGFFREGKEMKPIESVEADIYSLGRTIQFLLAHSKLEPPLSKKEEFQLKIIIQKCLGENQKHSYHQIKEILKQFPNRKYQRHNSEHSNHSKTAIIKKVVKKILVLIVILGVAAIAIPKLLPYAPFYPEKSEKNIPADMRTSVQEQKPLTSEPKIDTGLYTELGLVYFLELEDYEKSRTYFANASKENELARCYQNMSLYMLGVSGQSEEELAEVLKKGETLIPDKKNIRYYQSFLRVYSTLSIQTAKENLVRLGEYCFTLSDWQGEEKGQKTSKELREYLAQGYESIGQKEKETEQYLILTEMEGTTQEVEKNYARLAQLYQEEGKINEAADCCVSGIEKVKNSIVLRLLHIKIQCQDAGTDRGICAETIQKYLQEYPEIKDNSEFQKLQQEYEIKIEGEKIWVGNSVTN